MYKQTANVVYLGATVCENADLTVEINRRVLLASQYFRRIDEAVDQYMKRCIATETESVAK